MTIAGILGSAGRPSGTSRVDLGTACVWLGPARAFGSGGHETTASCLEVLRGLPGLADARVLDVGCGTGVLGLAALALGARSVVAVDTEADSIAATRENARLNGMSDRVVPILGDVLAAGRARFDLILANLYGDLILASIDEMVARLAATGRLLLSGIRWEERFEIQAALGRLGVEVHRTLMLEEYVTLLARGH